MDQKGGLRLLPEFADAELRMESGAPVAVLVIRAASLLQLNLDRMHIPELFFAKECGRLNAIDYAKFRSRSHDPVIRVYDAGQHDRKARAHWPVQRVVLLASRHAFH